MDKLIRSKKLQFEKSDLRIRIYKNESGLEYIKIEQEIGNGKNSISINPNNLEEIFETLNNYREEIALNQTIVDRYYINEADGQKMITIFLKGVTIKDLSMQYPYKEETIRNFLIENNIEIIEGLKYKPRLFRFRKKK